MLLRPVIHTGLISGAVILALIAPAATLANGAGIPPVGIPYVSTQSNGALFLGTVDLDGFKLENGQISATGKLLQVGPISRIPTFFPVKIIEATCEPAQFTLEIGPPPVLSLRDPLLLEQSAEDGSELRHRDFCAIANAFARKNLKEVVSQLNEEDEIAAGLLSPAPISALASQPPGAGACPWYEALGCYAYTLICTGLCAAIGPACLACLTEAAIQWAQEAALCGRCLRP